VAVVEALLALYPFPRLYVADLDALLGHGGHGPIVRQIRRRFPGLELWVDDAVHGAAALRRRSMNPAGVPVIGSETLATPFALRTCSARPFGAQPLLSMDFMGPRFLGPDRLLRTPTLWPSRVILMSLSRICAGRGPDLGLLTRMRRHGPHTRFYVAGGVRGIRDLHRLAHRGAAGALVASALHDGRLQTEALCALARP